MVKGLSSTGRIRIESQISDMFDSLSYEMLGYLPETGKRIIFSTTKPRYNLLNLFVDALGNREPNVAERDYAKGLIQNASNYISSLREKTKSSIVESIDSVIRTEAMKNNKPTKAQINAIIAEEMQKAKAHLKTIAEAETTKVRNGGVAADITKVSKSLNINDPSVYFVIVKDAKTCKYCIQNHLLPDGVTPKVLKLSDVRSTYLSTQDRKDGMCSIAGQHPHCRCTMAFLAPGFGFEAGRIKWVGYGHDEYQRQKLSIQI